MLYQNDKETAAGEFPGKLASRPERKGPCGTDFWTPDRSRGRAYFRRCAMKRKGFVLGIGLLLLGLTATGAQAQVYNPLAFGALGTALGFAAGGNAASAAIGGAAGVGAGILMNATTAYGCGYGCYDRPYAVQVHYPAYAYYDSYRPYYRYHNWNHGYSSPRWHHDYRHRHHFRQWDGDRRHR